MLNIRKYIETPYEWDGRSWQGCDCYGLVVLFYKTELQIDLLDYKHEFTGPEGVSRANYLAENVCNEFAGIPFEKARLNDIVLIRNGSEVPNHIGVVLGRRFLHTLDGYGCVTSKLSIWRRKIHGIYRHKDLL